MEAQAHLKDLSSLEKPEKEGLMILLHKAVNEVYDKNPSSKHAKLQCDKKEGIKITIRAHKENSDPPGTATVKRINVLGFDQKVTKHLVNQYKSGEIKSYHVTDLNKTNLIDEVSTLDTDTQLEVVETIIKNRNEHNMTNTEDVSLYLISKGKVDVFIIENWYRAILKTLHKLIRLADVNTNVINFLSNEQKQFLIDKVIKLSKELVNLQRKLEK